MAGRPAKKGEGAAGHKSSDCISEKFTRRGRPKFQTVAGTRPVFSRTDRCFFGNVRSRTFGRAAAAVAGEQRPRTRARARVAKEWDKITPADCQKLIESMPRRLRAVIKAKGAHTKY